MGLCCVLLVAATVERVRIPEKNAPNRTDRPKDRPTLLVYYKCNECGGIAHFAFAKFGVNILH